METVCTDLFIGDNWKMNQRPDGGLASYFYNNDTGEYDLVDVKPCPTSAPSASGG